MIYRNTPLAAATCVVFLLAALLVNGCREPAVAAAAAAQADSWIPDHRDEVIASVRFAPATPPLSEKQALSRARQQIQLGHASGEPRYFGAASVLLAPWWHANASPDVRVLMAVILQRQHNFADALTELEVAAKAAPANAQVWLSRATILKARGELQAAHRACRPLRRLVAAVISQACMASVEISSSRGQRTGKLLHYLVEHQPPDDPRTMAWVLQIAAQFAAARGEQEAAERYFQRALSSGSASAELHIARLDFLLQQQRLDDADTYLARLATRPLPPALLLRRALIARQRGNPDRHRDRQTLRQWQQLLQERGESELHLRESAQIALQLDANPARALTLALRNWQLQREVADARLVLASALASGRPQAAAAVRQWIVEQNVSHPQLTPLLARLEQTPWRS